MTTTANSSAKRRVVVTGMAGISPLGNDWTRLPRAEAQRRAAMVFSRWLLLIRGLVGSQHVPFGPTAETAVGQVIRDLTGYTSGADRMREITIPEVWQALRAPSAEPGRSQPC